MKHFTLSILLLASIQTYAQDTTAFNLIGVNNIGGMDYFNNDSTSMGSLPMNFNPTSAFALFQHPTNGTLYTVAGDGDSEPGVRNLYSINPLTGTTDLMRVFDNGYINTADIGDDNVIYYTTGNGNLTNQNSLFKYTLNSTVETLLSGPIATSSRGLEFHPTDSSVYLFEGWSNFLYKFDLSNSQVTTSVTTGMDDELHGAIYDESTNSFILSAYGGEMYTTDNTYLNGTLYHNTFDGVTGNNIMDIEKVKFLYGAGSEAMCPNDSVRINAFFGGVNYKWFKDGVEIAGEIDTFMYAKVPGVYRALMEVTMTEQINYIWSEEFTVTLYSLPNVTLSSAGNDTEICPGETIVLTGASGGTLQWYMDGAVIGGANGSTYGATSTGSYNQMKTNLNGCSDSASVAIVITVCDAGLNDVVETIFELYPNPTNGDLTVMNSISGTTVYSVYDLTGKTIQTGSFLTGKNNLNLKGLNPGVYLFTMNGVTKRIVKK